ncbi:MAG: transposase [Permianibacter sp.]
MRQHGRVVVRAAGTNRKAVGQCRARSGVSHDPSRGKRSARHFPLAPAGIQANPSGRSATGWKGSALDDSLALRQFVDPHSVNDPVPDATTILKFRRLPEPHALHEQRFQDVNIKLAQHGLRVRRGTIVDATRFAAPPSSQNEKRESDPEMRQTKKGRQYPFGMKIQVGTAARDGLVHSVVGTPLPEQQRKANSTLSNIRAKGEHAFAVVKYLCGQRKGHYRGLRRIQRAT